MAVVRQEIEVDGKRVELGNEKNLLEVIRKAGVDLPTFCYHSELSVYGACRMCLVELENGQIVASCSTPPQAGMRVKTMTPRVQHVRKMALELLLANHDRECTTCEKSGDCKLQELAQRFGIKHVRFGHRDQVSPIDDSSFAVVRDPNKCILCGDCVRMCAEVQSVGVLDFAYRGSKMLVSPAFGKRLADVDCVNCGQCAAVCPTGALVVKSQTQEAWNLLHDTDSVVIAQIAPAVRVALGEEFGLPAGEITLGKIVTALRRLGFAKVFDTSFTADLTVMEECSEFLERLKTGERLPLFTSCCPAWVKYAEQYYPDLLDNLSSCRSPQQMFGSLAKRFYAKELGISPDRMKVISIMPCTAKKFEAARPEFTVDGVPDVDLVLTTQELAQMIREAGLVFAELEDDSLDMPFGFTSGAGVIFGVTGGVAEAVLRSAYELVTKDELGPVNFEEVRGLSGLKAATVDVAGTEIRIAVVNGLSQARQVIAEMKSGRTQYDLIEVMACPTGCIGGGGQPVDRTGNAKQNRAKGLYRADKGQQLRRSTDNPLIQKVYEKWLDHPNSYVAHEALHTKYNARRRIASKGIEFTQPKQSDEKLQVAVCVGTCCYTRGSYEVLQDLARRIDEAGLSAEVNLRATFCFENCQSPANVQIGQRLVSNVTPKKSAALFLEIRKELQSRSRSL